MSRGKQKKIAAINDMTGFGRCALTVTIPVISAMRVQCCPIPTAVFSNHTAYKSYYKTDFTEQMPRYMEEWKKLDLCFEGILCGYLGSAEQIELAEYFIGAFSDPGTVVLVDPVMGDNGIRYTSYTEEMSRKMKDLALIADIVTPNLTECCILTGKEYRRIFEPEEIRAMGEELLRRMTERSNGRKRKKSVVISGIAQGEELLNLCLTEGEEAVWIGARKTGEERCGTGDVFAAVLAADAVNGTPLAASVRRAADFIGKCIRRSEELEIPKEDGICFEEFLSGICR